MINHYKINFEKRDAWIGVFWDFKELFREVPDRPGLEFADHLQIVICILPFLPITLSIRRSKWTYIRAAGE